MNLLVAIAIALLAIAPVPKTDPLKDAQAVLEGQWKVVAFTISGEDQLPEQLVGTVKATIKGDQFALTTLAGGFEATIILDPQAMPAEIDFGKTKESAKKAIYKLEGDKLTICWGLDGIQRPKNFKPTANNTVLVLERVKK